jgi:hypothetical protein
MGECVCCGVKSLRLCSWELSSNDFIKWRSIDYEIVGQIEEGKEKKKSKTKYNETPPREFIAYLKP